MSSFTISALCAALSCYTPSQLTRQSNSFIGAAGVERIIAGSTYQIVARGTSFAADQSWTLTSSTSPITSPTCTYSSEATNNECTWTETFTAPSAPGVTINYTAHDAINNRDATFSMITVSAIPHQPSLATSTETQYILTQTNPADTCVIVAAPSSYTYEATDLPATWNGVWSDKPDYVRHQVVDSSRSGLWSSVASSGVKYDFHAVCYNGVGHSVPYSVYNLVAVGSASAPAPAVISASMVSASSFRVTFQSPLTTGARGFYPDNIPVVSSCTLSYGRSETQVTQNNLNNGVTHSFEVNSVDLSVDIPFALSCSVDGTASAAHQGSIRGLSTGLSSSTGSYYDLSSSSAPVGFMSSSSAPVGFLSSSSEAPILLSSSSAEPALLSSSSSQAPVLLSSSTGSVVSSSSDAPAVLSSSTGAQESSSTGVQSSSSEAAVESSSSKTAVESSTGAVEESSTGATKSSSSAGAVSSSSGRSSSSSSSSPNVVVSPISNVPEGTVSVTFSIQIDEANVTESLVNALQGDISSNIAADYSTPENPLNGTQIRPFVVVTVGRMTSTQRRLLATGSVPVSFMVLGNITAVTGGTTNPSRPFNALAAATSVTTALSTGRFVSTETASLGAVVPPQQVEVLPVVAPEQPSSSTGADASSSSGFGEGDDSSSSGISDGAIAGAVVGSILGAALLVGIGVVAVRSGTFKKSDAVTQANANDIHNKGPLPINSFEENNVDMGYTEQPVRIHTDSPLAQPVQSPGKPPAEDVYSNGANDAHDVHVTIETRD